MARLPCPLNSHTRTWGSGHGAMLLLAQFDPFGFRCSCSSRIFFDNQKARPILYYQNVKQRPHATECAGAIGVHRITVGDGNVLPKHNTVENRVSHAVEVAPSIECV